LFARDRDRTLTGHVCVSQSPKLDPTALIQRRITKKGHFSNNNHLFSSAFSKGLCPFDLASVALFLKGPEQKKNNTLTSE
jgi:hypothetical protein